MEPSILLTQRDELEADHASVFFQGDYQRIYRYILSMIRDPAEAEDLTQETFLRAYRQRDSLREAAARTAWLYRIATHVCLDRVRQYARRNPMETYLLNMMRVLEFDARRRGHLISQIELDQYTHWLAVSVTEAIHFFIGHDQPSPRDETRYLAVTGAHIAHLLRDKWEDIQAGYYNIPREYLAVNGIGPQDVESDPYRAWVQERVKLARAYFLTGKDYMAQIANLRTRIAGYAYIARFERVLYAIERQSYRLEPAYLQSRGLGSGIKMSGAVLALALFHPVRK